MAPLGTAGQPAKAGGSVASALASPLLLLFAHGVSLTLCIQALLPSSTPSPPPPNLLAASNGPPCPPPRSPFLHPVADGNRILSRYRGNAFQGCMHCGRRRYCGESYRSENKDCPQGPAGLAPSHLERSAASELTAHTCPHRSQEKGQGPGMLCRYP